MTRIRHSGIPISIVFFQEWPEMNTINWRFRHGTYKIQSSLEQPNFGTKHRLLYRRTTHTTVLCSSGTRNPAQVKWMKRNITQPWKLKVFLAHGKDGESLQNVNSGTKFHSYLFWTFKPTPFNPKTKLIHCKRQPCFYEVAPQPCAIQTKQIGRSSPGKDETHETLHSRHQPHPCMHLRDSHHFLDDDQW